MAFEREQASEQLLQLRNAIGVLAVDATVRRRRTASMSALQGLGHLRQLELLKQASLPNLLQAQRLRGRTSIGDHCERLLAAHPGTGIDPFSWCFHKPSIPVRSSRKNRYALLKRNGLTVRFRSGRAETSSPSFRHCCLRGPKNRLSRGANCWLTRAV